MWPSPIPRSETATRSSPGARPSCDGMDHRAGIAQRCALDRVLRGERGAEHDGLRVRHGMIVQQAAADGPGVRGHDRCRIALFRARGPTARQPRSPARFRSGSRAPARRSARSASSTARVRHRGVKNLATTREVSFSRRAPWGVSITRVLGSASDSSSGWGQSPAQRYAVVAPADRCGARRSWTAMLCEPSRVPQNLLVHLEIAVDHSLDIESRARARSDTSRGPAPPRGARPRRLRRHRRRRNPVMPSSMISGIEPRR